ncbi:hypothetical protein [Corynebacterium marquesiae]|uniref:hypothetical protein n=1 Tax=Corynebacterium marquesiae TaxID=2913503 RepID=UPI0038D07DB3
MPNPTRKEIIYAHDGLDILCERADKSAPSDVLKNYILKALPPRPQPTMAEVEWDDDKHYLAEAEHPEYGKVIMLGNCAYECIEVLIKRKSHDKYAVLTSNNLTPTGKRYTLTKVQE